MAPIMKLFLLLVMFSFNSYFGLSQVNDSTPQLKFSILQNPASEFLDIQITNEAWTGAQIVVFNVIGNKVLKTAVTASNLHIPIDDWKNGVYLVQIKFKSQTNQTLVKRFVKT